MHNMKRTHKIKLLNLWNQRKNYETKIKNTENHGMKSQKTTE